MPRVSVVIASYNHEKYVGECIRSALDQTYKDFEIVITDDGSSDGTVSVIRGFDDPRIRLYTYGNNRGACTAINNCIRKAAGEYIAVLNSDDAWEPTKLEKQVAYLDAHPEIGAVFTTATFVDESSTPILEEHYKYFHILEQENRSRYAWLKQFFFDGNCLCHPSILIRRKCYADIGPYDERMANLPDMDMWVRLCLKYDIYILNEKLVRFRIAADKSSAGADKLSHYIRIRFEYLQILDHYREITDSETLLRVFPDAADYGPVETEAIPYLMGRLALKAQEPVRHLWGLQTIFDFLGESDTEAAVAREYGFHYRDFHDLSAEHDIFGVEAAMASGAGPTQGIPRVDPQRHGRLTNFAIRLHWMAASSVLKIYGRMRQA